MGPPTCPPAADSPVVPKPALTEKVALYSLRSVGCHLLDTLSYLLSTASFFIVMSWLLITRRLDGNISGWSVLGSLAKRGLKIYKLPVKVLRRIRRRSRVQGSTA